MADASVQFLLENLKQLVIYHGHLIADAQDEIVELEKELRLLQAFLQDMGKKHREDGRLSELLRQIRDATYDAEDIIDTFVTQAASVKSKNYIHKLFKKPVNLSSIATQIEAVGSRVRGIYGDNRISNFPVIDVGDESLDEYNEVPIVRQENIVGFEDEAEKLIGYLREEQDQLDVISIVGMPGLGKTTLAGMIYRDPQTQYEFPTRIWVNISNEFTRKNIFLAILKELTGVKDGMYNKTDEELARTVAAYLQSGKFLIVMDDVWSPVDWEKLKIALPKNNKGKVLITSRSMEVGRYANSNRCPHQLRFLTQDESWLLLRYEVFGVPDFAMELESYGRVIVDRCDGLPLAIVVIGGILAKKVCAKEDLVAVRDTWKKVSENVNTLIVVEDSTKRMEKIITLSYDNLPYHLRDCFLYLGMFPEDFEIPAWKLIRMWIAEGFVVHKENISLEDIAENYLEDLINMNLVRVDRRTRDGKVKTCRLHDMLREFCRYEAGNERRNFFHEMKRSDVGSFNPPVQEIPNFRRLCIHSNIMSFINSKPSGPRIRSFVCFPEEEINLKGECISYIPEAFKLLRVMEVKPIRFPKIPSEMFQLVHLRYMAISITLAILPQAFSKLWNLQTLIVDTIHRTLEIRADIWKMTRMRHFKTNASAVLPKPDKGGSGCDSIQSLGTISPQSCTDVVFEKARYLKKLGIRGRLAMLMDTKNGSFSSLEKLANLEKLKLVNDVFPHSASENPLPSFPLPYQFLPKLKSLGLADTFLDWANMSTIGLLENLKVLKLKDKAFMGESWVVADGGFRKLEVLYIGRTNLVTWSASEHHFPKLRTLELRNCEYLRKVPSNLADIPSFLQLELYRSTKSAAASAKAIYEKKQIGKEQITIYTKFKLSIFPPAE